MTTSRFALLLLALPLTVSGAENPAPEGLHLSDCIIQAPLAESRVSAAFFTLQNDSNHNFVLRSVDSPLTPEVQLHAMSMSEGVMTMRRLPSYLVTPGKHVFQKGGNHVMLENLQQMPVVGEHYPLTLHFDGGQTLTCQALVLDVPTIIQRQKQRQKP